jgi:hypothetical protein
MLWLALAAPVAASDPQPLESSALVHAPAPAAVDTLIPPPLPAVSATAVLADPPRCGQSHWVNVNLSLFQPTIARLQVGFHHNGHRTWIAEVYAGSVLFEGMYGGGMRVAWTVHSSRHKDALMIAPGVGVHILPQTQPGSTTVGYGWFGQTTYWEAKTVRTYVAWDVDISWCHDFSPNFAIEFGTKLGLATKVAGTWGSYDDAKSLRFGEYLYPIVSVWWGMKF